MKVSKCTKQTIEIPISEYTHLKECKSRLIEIHERQIMELNSEMMTADINTIINNTISNISTTNNTLINRISAYLKNLIKNSI
jgi:hypothetical protein